MKFFWPLSAKLKLPEIGVEKGNVCDVDRKRLLKKRRDSSYCGNIITKLA